MTGWYAALGWACFLLDGGCGRAVCSKILPASEQYGQNDPRPPVTRILPQVGPSTVARASVSASPWIPLVTGRATELIRSARVQRSKLENPSLEAEHAVDVNFDAHPGLRRVVVGGCGRLCAVSRRL